MPQHEAGTRIDPPPSEADAIETMPDATAAAEPPLDPPGERSKFQGFLAGPNKRDSVTPNKPNSGVLVFPSEIRPISNAA